MTQASGKAAIVARECPCCASVNLLKSSAILMPFVAHRALDWRPTHIDKSWGLKTVPSGLAYPLCNSVICADCLFLFLDLRFSDSELSALYHRYREAEYVELREFYEPGYRIRNEQLEGLSSHISDVEEFLIPFLKQNPKILDWGGDTGKNTPFKNRNSLLHIFDISNKTLIPGATAVDKRTAQKEQYDLIVCSQVLEHLPYPFQTLSEIRDCMKENTLLYIELPLEEIVRTSNSSSELLNKKRHWHEHINFFSEHSIKALLNRLDLRLVQLEKSYIAIGNPHSWHFRVVCKI
jgi:hypothetical protein